MYVLVIWYIFLRFGILCQEKSGNPDWGIKIYVLISSLKQNCRLNGKKSLLLTLLILYFRILRLCFYTEYVLVFCTKKNLATLRYIHCPHPFLFDVE
jgi:hypothetical protein